MKSSKLIWLLLVAGFAGCAQLAPPAAPNGNEPIAVVDDDDGASASQPAANTGQFPPQALSEDILFDMLVGEIGLQRRRADIANGAYSDLLKRSHDPRIARRATEIGLYTGNLKKATEGAKAWADSDPASMQARHMLLALLLKEGRYDEAEPVVQQVFAGMPAQLPQVWLELHDLMIKQTDREAMVRFAARLAQPYPNIAEARFTVGALAWRAGQYELADKEVSAAEQLRPDWELAALFHAQLLQRTSQDKAREYLGEYLHRFPKSRDVRQNYARLLAAAKLYPAAREQMKILVDTDPRSLEAMLAYAGLSLEMKDPQAAVTTLLDAQKLQLKDASAVNFMLGQAYEDMGKLDEAGKAFLAIDSGERFLAAQARYVRLLVKQNQLDRALTHLDTVPTVTTEQKIGLQQLKAQSLRDAKEYRRAYEVLDTALKQYPGNNDLLYDRAMIAERLDLLAESERDLREILKQRPEDSMVLNALGYTLADRTERLDEALVLIEKALKLQPNDPFILDSMGWVKYRMGKLDESLDYLNRAYTAKTDPEIAAHLGEVLWAMGKRGEARTMWQGSLKENPGHETLMQVIKRLDH